MQSKPSKKLVKKEEERAEETKPVAEAPKSRSTRTSKTPTEKVEVVASPAKHRKSPARSSRHKEGIETAQPKIMGAAAGAYATSSTIVDPVGVMVSTPNVETPAMTTATTDHKPRVLSEEIAHLAYSYWAARGFTHGMADEDWIRAEAELLGR